MSVMSKRIFKKIKDNAMIEKLFLPNNFMIKVAGGKRLIPIGAYRIPIEFRGRIIVQELVIIDQLLSDAILGIDFINQNNIIIEVKESGTEVLETSLLDEINSQMTERIDKMSENEIYAIAGISRTIPANQQFKYRLS